MPRDADQLGHGTSASWSPRNRTSARSAALEYAAQKVRVNAVCPGYIDTPMMGRFTGGTPEGRAKVIKEEPVGRMGKPEKIAAAVVWLCSDAAAFVIGHAMVIDGGQTVQ
jgi:NAD(P)-dependent dehydrogenase (short-subunit alcohol dehydrogenase family)